MNPSPIHIHIFNFLNAPAEAWTRLCAWLCGIEYHGIIETDDRHGF
jgi:hypothetical protein